MAYVQLFDTAARAQLLVRAPTELPDPISEAFDRVNDGDFVNGLMQVDIETQLPDDLLLLTDKMTMAASVECRVPLLSNAMVDLTSRLPSSLKIRGSRLKYLLRRTMQGVLPEATLQKSKRGFGAPMGAWLKKELRPVFNVLLSREAVQWRGLLNPAAVNEALMLHQASRRDYSDHLQCLMNLEIWCRIFLDGRRPDDVAAELAERTKGTAAA
jgi:asparagine synthase (glutamine-hydrolysing)